MTKAVIDDILSHCVLSEMGIHYVWLNLNMHGFKYADVPLDLITTVITLVLHLSITLEYYIWDTGNKYKLHGTSTLVASTCTDWKTSSALLLRYVREG